MFFSKKNNFYTVEKVNEDIKNSPEKLINFYETIFSKEIDRIENTIIRTGVRMILLTGPSSSGKTTTSHKISEDFLQSGIKTIIISLDNFFKCKEDFPKNKDGQPDFESVDGLELDLLCEKLNSLIEGKTTVLPVFDFIEGKRNDFAFSARLDEKCVAIIEGIHALNPKILNMLPKKSYIGIYISAHSNFIDNSGKEILSKRDIRFLRRMIRDFYTRGSSPQNTFAMWEGVLKSEEAYIKNTKYEANLKINTTFPYDPAFLKKEAIPLLSQITADSIYFKKAGELINALSLFEKADKKILPDNALIREFVGGSKYYKK